MSILGYDMTRFAQYNLVIICHSSTPLFTSEGMSSWARPDFAELDVFLVQHILLTLEQHFNPKM